MSDFKAKMHQIRFRLGLRYRPRWGSLQHSPDPLAGFKGHSSKGMEDRGQCPGIALSKGGQWSPYRNQQACGQWLSCWPNWNSIIDCGHTRTIKRLNFDKRFLDYHLTSTILHLLSILQTRFSVTQQSLDWFRSYLTQRTQVFTTNSGLTDPITLTSGVPQGSSIGPAQFISYTECTTDTFSSLCSIPHVRRWHTVLPPLFSLRNPVTSRSSVLVYWWSHRILRFPASTTQPCESGSGSVHTLTWREYQNASVRFRSVGLILSAPMLSGTFKWCLLRQRAVNEEPRQQDRQCMLLPHTKTAPDYPAFWRSLKTHLFHIAFN